jgi:hypothetical protein
MLKNEGMPEAITVILALMPICGAERKLFYFKSVRKIILSLKQHK